MPESTELKIMDFRSDTVTKPTDEMRKAMAAAEVGDDVYGDDPSMNELLKYAAGLVGMESALYACSGTMGNLMAIMTHASRGDGVLMGVASHTWKNEVGNVASLAGVMPYPLDDSSGCPTPQNIRSAFVSADNVHYAGTTLTVLENTHNSAGGLAVDVKTFAEAADTAHSLGMKVHVDGARIFNAVAFYGCDVKDYTSKVDSIQICLSKGLGAPMGSLLCGRKDFMDRALKWRKALGGGQRQSGIAAAAGLIALRDMRERLTVDHRNAGLLADLLQSAGIDVEQAAARTNMIFFRLGQDCCDTDEFMKRCLARGLLLGAAGERRIRMVTHLDVDENEVRQAAGIVKEVISK